MDTLDKIIEQISTETSDDDEIFRAFQKLIKDNVRLPADGFVIGEPVSVTAIEYNGNVRRGLTARCSSEDGSVHEVALAEVVFPKTFKGGQYIAAFRKWLDLDLDPFPAESQVPYLHRRHHKVTADDIDLTKPVELVALSVKDRTARCRLLESDRIITLRAGDLSHVVPGQIITIKPKKQWRYGGHPYLSGEIQSARLEARALGLVPLGLADMGIWDPEEHYWGEEDDPLEKWEKLIIAKGPRPMFEMEQVLPGEYDDDPFNDPILQAVDLENIGKSGEAKKLLMDLCQADLRCLDAHSHLGSLVFNYFPSDAIEHYETGLRIGQLSLGDDFTGVLLWGFINNRPFLRCMHGYGLCLWRMGRFEEAEHVFDRMLWLNPSDNQGARFILDEVKEKITWEDSANR